MSINTKSTNNFNAKPRKFYFNNSDYRYEVNNIFKKSDIREFELLIDTIILIDIKLY